MRRHELGYTVMARRYNIPVCRITLFIFGSVAQIAAEPPSARAEFWIALAGPAVSLALAVKRIRPDTELGEAMAEMDRDGVNQLPVMVDGHCLGLLSRGDLVDFRRARWELGI